MVIYWIHPDFHGSIFLPGNVVDHNESNRTTGLLKNALDDAFAGYYCLCYGKGVVSSGKEMAENHWDTAILCGYGFTGATDLCGRQSI